MKLYDGGLIVMGLIAALAAVTGYFSQKKLGPDNVVEEAMEDIIQSQTGAKVDLSPESPE